MAYLHINGYTVKTQHGGERSPLEVLPRRDYSPNGNYQFARNALGRQWRFQSIPLPKAEAMALAGMVNMQGDHWRFDVAAANRPSVLGTTTAPSFYSDKRRHAYSTSVSTNPVATAVSCFGKDGALVYDRNGVAQRPWAGVTGNLLCEPGATNILSAANANPETSADLTLVDTSGGASLATDTTRYWAGAGCVKVVTGANNLDGIRSSNVTTGYSPGNRVVASCYVRGNAGGEQIRIGVQEDSGAGYVLIGAMVNHTLPSTTDAWMRLEVSVTTSSPTSNGIRIIVYNAVASAQTWYIDGLQLEVRATGPATAWLAGGTTRAAGDLQYANLVTSMTKGITFNAWVKHLRTGLGVNHFVCDVGVASEQTSRINLLYNTSDAIQVNANFFSAGANSAMTATGSATNNAWHMVTGVFDPAVPGIYVYVDGALVASSTTISGAGRVFAPSTMTGDLHIGNSASLTTVWGPGPITHVSILPFAAPAAIVSGLYNSAAGASGGSPGLTPLVASGTFLGAGEPFVAVYGAVNNLTNVPRMNGATWDPGAAVVDFTLTEAVGR